MGKKVYVGKSNIHMAGRGVFASSDFKKNAVIEVCPVIVMEEMDTNFIMQTMLSNYVYEHNKKGCLLALGYGSLYNHHLKPNAKYELAESEEPYPGMLELYIIATKPIAADEEIYINYGKHYDEMFKK